MIPALATQALGLGLNYVFTMGVVVIAPVAEAGRVFWYLNLMFILSLTVQWGADTWFVRRRAAAAVAGPGGQPDAEAGERSVRESAQLCLVLQIALMPVLLGYVLWVERDGLGMATLLVLALAAYTGCQLASMDREASGQRAAALYMRAVAPYVLATPVVLLLWLFDRQIHAEGILALVCGSSFVNLLVGGHRWYRRGLAQPVPWARLARCLRDFLPNVGTSVLNFVSGWLAVFVAKAMFGDAELAQINFVMRIATVVGVPIVVIGVSYSARMAQARDPVRLRQLYFRSAVAAGAVALPVYAALVIASPFMLERLAPAYDLRLELAIMGAGHLGAMLFGAQYVLFAMTDNIARLNTAIALSTVLGGLLMVAAAHAHGVTGLLVAAAFAAVLKPAISAVFTWRILHPRPGA